MDPFINPFAPGARCRPPHIAGRQPFINAALTSCGRLLRGRSGRPMMLLGLRGTGKTVLLNEIGRQVAQHDFIVTKIESPEHESLAELLYPPMQKALRAFSTVHSAKALAKEGLTILQRFASIFRIDVAGIEISTSVPDGVADTGNLEVDLPDLFATLGKVAQAAGKGWLLLIDEVQYLNSKDLSALLVALHHINQLELPIMFIGAGLPLLAKQTGDAKSYAERLIQFCDMGPLSNEEIYEAIVQPIYEEKVCIEPEAVHWMAQGTHGYPFFLQEWAYCAWNIADGNTITLNDVKVAYSETLHALDKGFFKVRLNRLTPQEIEFVQTMASLGQGPYKVGAIAKAMHKNTLSIGPVRTRITQKGMIYSPQHGYVAFTVPLFDEFIRRHQSD